MATNTKQNISNALREDKDTVIIKIYILYSL